MTKAVVLVLIILVVVAIGAPYWLRKLRGKQVGLEGLLIEVRDSAVGADGREAREVTLKNRDKGPVLTVQLCDKNCGQSGETRYVLSDLQVGQRVRVVALRAGRNRFQALDVQRVGESDRFGRIVGIGRADIRSGGHVIQKFKLREVVNNDLTRDIEVAACLQACPAKMKAVDITGLAVGSVVTATGALDSEGSFNVNTLQISPEGAAQAPAASSASSISSSSQSSQSSQGSSIPPATPTPLQCVPPSTVLCTFGDSENCCDPKTQVCNSGDSPFPHAWCAPKNPGGCPPDLPVMCKGSNAERNVCCPAGSGCTTAVNGQGICKEGACTIPPQTDCKSTGLYGGSHYCCEPNESCIVVYSDWKGTLKGCSANSCKPDETRCTGVIQGHSVTICCLPGWSCSPSSNGNPNCVQPTPTPVPTNTPPPTATASSSSVTSSSSSSSSGNSSSVSSNSSGSPYSSSSGDSSVSSGDSSQF